MACTREFIDFVCDTLSPLGEVRSRKMMGDYIIYVNGESVITACDNICYVKKLPCIAELMAILDFSDKDKVLKVVNAL